MRNIKPVRQSMVHWCFAEHWTEPEAIAVAKRLGLDSVEAVAPKFFPLLRDAGLVCALAAIDMSPDMPFAKGFNNPRHHERVIQATRDAIDACVPYRYPNVVTFTGYDEGLSREEGADNCVVGFKKVIGYAEEKNVTLCLEMLNSRVETHPMKGHPGYQGDHTEYCVDIIKRVGSPNLKLLFDIYHVQVMEGDIIRRIRQHKEYIGHVHTAGNPGRGELDERQEIKYRPIIETLTQVGYEGFVSHEFMPTRDPEAGLRQAIEICDVTRGRAGD